jgi:hypothetical protein
MYKLAVSRHQLSYVRSYKHSVNGFHYDPTSRCLCLSTTSDKDVNEIRAYFLIKNINDKTTANNFNIRLELPPPRKLNKFVINPKPDSRVVKTSDYCLCTLYSNLYCLDIQHDQIRLILLDTATDTHYCGTDNPNVVNTNANANNVTPTITRSFKLYTPGKCYVSVLDNVLLIHSCDTTLSFLYDIMSEGEEPIVGGNCAGYTDVGGDGDDDNNNNNNTSNSSNNNESANNSAALYSGAHTLLPPSYLLNPHSRGTLYSLKLNLSLILDAQYQNSIVVPFMMRRREGDALRLLGKRLDTIIDESSSQGLSEWLKHWAQGYRTCRVPAPAVEEGGSKRRSSSTAIVMSKLRNYKERYRGNTLMGGSSPAGGIAEDAAAESWGGENGPVSPTAAESRGGAAGTSRAVTTTAWSEDEGGRMQSSSPAPSKAAASAAAATNLTAAYFENDARTLHLLGKIRQVLNLPSGGATSGSEPHSLLSSFDNLSKACEKLPHASLSVLSQNDIVDYQIMPNIERPYIMEVLLAMVKTMSENNIRISINVVVVTMYVLCREKQNSLGVCMLRSKAMPKAAGGGGRAPSSGRAGGAGGGGDAAASPGAGAGAGAGSGGGDAAREAASNVAGFGEDSLELAECLLTLASQFSDDNLKVHALDMLKRLGKEGQGLMVKTMLDEGSVHDAIFFARGASYDPPAGGVGASSFSSFPSPVDFWRATVAAAASLSTIGERCALFYHLYTFLQTYSPASVDSGVGRRGSYEDARDREKKRGSSGWKRDQKEKMGGLRMISELAKSLSAATIEEGGPAAAEGGAAESGDGGWESLFEENKAVKATIKTLFGFQA